MSVKKKLMTMTIATLETMENFIKIHSERKSLRDLTPEELEKHLAKSTYGNFTLSDGIRPGLDFHPQEGYRHDEYYDEQNDKITPVLMAAASREKIFDLFQELVTAVGEKATVILETSHFHDGIGHRDIMRDEIDTPVLLSNIQDFEDQLINDGSTGIAVISRDHPMEVQFDEHKLFIVYGEMQAAYEDIFHRFGLQCDEYIKFITESEHVHVSHVKYITEFQNLMRELGCDEYDD